MDDHDAREQAIQQIAALLEAYLRFGSNPERRNDLRLRRVGALM